MATDSRTLSNLVRVGNVSSLNPQNCTARVVFEDKQAGGQSLVSAEMPVLSRGSAGNRDYWLPDVGDQVVCLILPNGKNQGFILGTFFSEAQPPNSTNGDIRRIDFGDGSFVEFNRATGGLTIQCTGPVVINGSTVNIN